MWYLFEESSGWCIVHEKNVLQAGSVIDLGTDCKYFYQVKEYVGKLLMKDEYHDKLNNELTRLKKSSKPSSSKEISKVPEMDGPTRSKRKTTQVEFYGAIDNSGASSKSRKTLSERPKMSEEERTRQRILDMNKREALRRLNASLLSKVKECTTKTGSNNDEDWNPSPNDDSDDSIIEDVLAHTIAAKNNRVSLLKSAKDRSEPSKSCPVTLSPTKEELKRQNEILQMKLQMAYEGSNKSPGAQAQPLSENLSESSNQEMENGSSFNVQNSSKQANELSVERVSSAASQSDTNMDDSLKTVEFESLTYQLYGAREDTTDIGRGIYCITSVITSALTNSCNVNHVIRRLMVGVFRPSQVMDCTATGQTWRAGGQERMKQKMKPLHEEALKAIVDFANGFAKKKNWPIKKFNKCKSTISGKLIEMKKQFQNGKLSD